MSTAETPVVLLAFASIADLSAALLADPRSVLVMHDIDGHTMPEIARALHVPLNTAYSRLRLARHDFEAAVRSLSPESHEGSAV